MQLGNIVRVLEVPASVPAETAPHYVPGPVPAVPATEPSTVPEPVPAAPEEHAASAELLVPRSGGGEPWAR